MIGFPKPHRGAYALSRKQASAKRKADEQSVMRQARRRDGSKCRVPGCAYGRLTVDVSHVDHRGMGGNPRGDRTVLPLLWCACRIHHSMFDRGELDVEPLTSAGMDGPAAFYLVNIETGRREHIGSERVIGVSTERGYR